MKKQIVHYRSAVGEAQETDVYPVTLSSSNTDRQGDRIAVDGWHVKGTAITKSPNPNVRVPLQVDHDSSVLKTVGFVNDLHYVGDKVKGTIHLAPSGISPLIDEVRSRMRAGLIRDTSVGFKPEQYDSRDEGVDWQRQELMELSLVSQPANADATIGASALARFKAFLGDVTTLDDDVLVPVKRLTRTERVKAADALKHVEHILRRSTKALTSDELAKLQGAHDYIVSLGATCAPVAEESSRGDVLAGIESDDIDLEQLTRRELADAISEVVARRLLEVTGRLL